MKNNERNELHTKCKIIRTAKDLEALVFTIQLGPLSIICIANIPEEGSLYAPVYIKFKLFENDRRDRQDRDRRDDPEIIAASVASEAAVAT